ncbi:hypothetical protein [Enterobacter phage 04_vB_Eclo_IJM]|nr:hypothetical protein [Enterobacter phage 04_vB_Eclo_IJM]
MGTGPRSQTSPTDALRVEGSYRSLRGSLHA